MTVLEKLKEKLGSSASAEKWTSGASAERNQGVDKGAKNEAVMRQLQENVSININRILESLNAGSLKRRNVDRLSILNFISSQTYHLIRKNKSKGGCSLFSLIAIANSLGVTVVELLLPPAH